MWMPVFQLMRDKYGVNLADWFNYYHSKWSHPLTITQNLTISHQRRRQTFMHQRCRVISIFCPCQFLVNGTFQFTMKVLYYLTTLNYMYSNYISFYNFVPGLTVISFNLSTYANPCFFLLFTFNCYLNFLFYCLDTKESTSVPEEPYSALRSACWPYSIAEHDIQHHYLLCYSYYFLPLIFNW